MKTIIVLSCWFVVLVGCCCYASDTGPVAWWSFDHDTDKAAVDSAGRRSDPIIGFYDYSEGVIGKAICFDGYTTCIERPASSVPALQSGFTIEAWVALQTYPWNWTAIVNQQGPVLTDKETGGKVYYDPGLIGIRYDSADLTRPAGVDLLTNPTSDWTGGENNWSARWKGYIEAPATGPVKFEAEVDNGLRMKIDSRLVLDAWKGGEGVSGTILMEKGKKYPVELTYYQDGGESILKLYWTWPGHPRSKIPDNALWHDRRQGRLAEQSLEKGSRQPARSNHIFFGIDAYGHVGLKVSLSGKNYECIGKQQLPLLKWSHLVATCRPEKGLVVYINGREAARLAAEGTLQTEGLSDMWIGKSLQKMAPILSERAPSRRLKSYMVLDGLLDELKLYNTALSAEQVKQRFESAKPAKQQPLQFRKMPSGPADLPRRFCAYYCRLRYDDKWERLWRVGEHPDILVTFDQSPVRVVFWRGTSYGASWISENGKWMGDQSLEDGGTGWGCSEHMSDKQCRYSHVRLIENHDARIVVHWRYAVCDIRYTINHQDPVTGWGDWTDEYFYIYPDAVAIRKQLLWTSRPGGFQWQETIMFNQPGTRPEDNVEIEAITLANLAGRSHTYSWAERPPESFPLPENPIIQMTNLKSKYRPFIIFQPGTPIYAFGGRNKLSHFRWWNHWPVAQLPNDGRRATGPDRPAHTSLSSSRPICTSLPDGSIAAATLYGMTDRPIEELVPLARSWNYPPQLKLLCTGFESKGYDKYQRAYVLTRTDKQATSALEFELAATEDSPVVNPAFVIENWGDGEAALKLNGREIKRGKSFRYGRRRTLQGTDLIVWIEKQSTTAVNIQLVQVKP